jgi:uncharacterized membrane protein
MPDISFILLIVGYSLIIGLGAHLIRKWMVVPETLRGPRFNLVRKLNVAVIVLSCIAAMALMKSFSISGHFPLVGSPILILLFALSGSPKRFKNR